MNDTIKPLRPYKALKLLAKDEEDLDVMGALLQDALVPLVDTIFLASDRRFVMVVNRFVWPDAHLSNAPPQPPALAEGADASFEDAADEAPYGRVNCGLSFENVRAVRSRGFDREARDQILNLLTIKPEKGQITLIFSDDAVIQLKVDKIRCRMEDLGEIWPTRWKPDHEGLLEGVGGSQGNDGND